MKPLARGGAVAHRCNLQASCNILCEHTTTTHFKLGAECSLPLYGVFKVPRVPRDL